MALGKDLTRPLGCIALSFVLVLPVIIFSPVSGDRPSHVYNAWLAQLIERGEAPGLRLAPMTTNILYDTLLSAFAHFAGLRVAEKIVTSIFVLLFFWGMFSLAGALSGSLPWRLVPLVAMLCYGWTFTIGLMNFYGSIALGSLGVALWWSDRPGGRLIVLPLAALAWLGHPLGVVWLIAAIGWFELARRFRMVWTAGFVALLIGAMFPLRAWLTHHFQTFEWTEPVWVRAGVDQFWLYRGEYKCVGAGVVLFLLVWIATEAATRWRERRSWMSIIAPVELSCLLLAAFWILPNGIKLSLYPAPIEYIASRSTVLLVALLACVCATSAPRKWHAPVLILFATAFFWMNLGDMARLARMDRQAQQLVRTVPAQPRVIALLFWPDSRVLIYHLPDLACIGYCYSYANYEPVSQQFRVRASAPNRIVITTPDANTQIGRYMVQPQDQPIYQLYQCGSVDNLCLEQLSTGEINGMQVVRKGWLGRH